MLRSQLSDILSSTRIAQLGRKRPPEHTDIKKAG
jgi:hypothetical protein